MVELVDTRDLKSLADYVRAGSSPAGGTKQPALLKAGFFRLEIFCSTVYN